MKELNSEVSEINKKGLIQGFTNFLKTNEPSQNSRRQEVDIKSFMGRTRKHTTSSNLGSRI
jgi:hypothetical protein